MTNEELVEMAQKSNQTFVKVIDQNQKAAYLIGQIHGKLHTLIEKSATDSVRQDLIHLFDYITQEAGNLYYKPEEIR